MSILSTVGLGAACFGLVIGWVTYRTLVKEEKASIADIAAVIGAVGGATVTGMFKDETAFGLYCIGLAVGFFGFLIYVNIFKNPTYIVMKK